MLIGTKNHRESDAGEDSSRPSAENHFLRIPLFRSEKLYPQIIIMLN
jgi:hypothetical protein